MAWMEANNRRKKEVKLRKQKRILATFVQAVEAIPRDPEVTSSSNPGASSSGASDHGEIMEMILLIVEQDSGCASATDHDKSVFRKRWSYVGVPSASDTGTNCGSSFTFHRRGSAASQDRSWCSSTTDHGKWR